MKVFKFGGASVKDAPSVFNLAKILQLYPNENLVIVISAMGKTTNLMEELVEAYTQKNREELFSTYQNLYQLHYEIIEQLHLTEDVDFLTLFEQTFDKLENKINEEPSEYYEYEYDQIVSFGEIISTTIVSGFLNSQNIENHWIDARKIIRTDNKYTEAKIDWTKTTQLVQEKITPLLSEKDNEEQTSSIVITQGFIGHTQTKQTTTLGREGSDFTAGILAWCLNAQSVIIWKDVPGMLNADPKYFNNCVKLNQISFKEAIELSYYGASVIHPKTIKPLQNKNIPLYVKSFLSPKEKGTLIHSSSEDDDKIPSYIFKDKQTLISFIPRDFSFIDESNLSKFFTYFAEKNIKINLMQNSAISYSICIDENNEKLNAIIETFGKDFKIKYNSQLELLTIRHFNDKVIDLLTKNKTILAEQKSRQTARFVMKTT